jgi:hypothetical protein
MNRMYRRRGIRARTSGGRANGRSSRTGRMLGSIRYLELGTDGKSVQHRVRMLKPRAVGHSKRYGGNSLESLSQQMSDCKRHIWNAERIPTSVHAGFDGNNVTCMYSNIMSTIYSQSVNTPLNIPFSPSDNPAIISCIPFPLLV